MDGKSLNITEEQKKRLRELFPEVFTEGKIDWDKLKGTLGEDVDLGERYALSWKGKSNVFRAIQEPTTKTFKPVREESVNFDETENLFIEGDNLEALKVLQRAYYGKIKMIYIDPPYNTGNDFVYNDKFAQSQKEYAQEAGIKNGNGNVVRTDGLRKNSKDGGHFHSNWLNMMYPRLYLARNLLKQDGVIFVSIDDNEVHNLRMIMNEIFGEENFIATFVKQSKVGGGSDTKFIVKEHEYCLVYARSQDSTEDFFVEHDNEYLKRYKHEDEKGKYFWDTLARRGLKNPVRYTIAAPDGTEITDDWNRSPERLRKELESGEVRFYKKGDGSWSVQFKQRLNLEGKKPRSMTAPLGGTIEGKQDIAELFGSDKIFSYPKSVKFLKYLVNVVSKDGDIVLDFFSGSGTLAHAVKKLNAEDNGNRKWICVQLPEETDEKSEAYQAGYRNIADIAKERIRRAGKKIAEEHKDAIAKRETPLDLGFKVLKLDETNLKIWDSSVHDPEELKKQAQLHLDPIKDGADEEDLLLELMLKSGIEPTAKREKIGEYWKINNGELIICLTKELTQDIFTEILAAKPQKIILLDSSFNGNNQLKTNLTLQAEQSNTDLQVVWYGR